MQAVLDDERPLTARSVVASTLLGIDPPVLPSRLLVRSGELFGIAEGATRVALSRMVAGGELIADEGSYRLAGPLVRRQARQLASRAGATRAWDGRWTLALVVMDERTAADRSALRTAALVLRLGERRPGVWLRPDNLTDRHASAVSAAAAVVASQCERFDARPAGDPTALAAHLWDLDGWVRRAQALHEALAVLLPRLAAATEAETHLGTGLLGPSFVVSAATLRHFQADPLLPLDLLPTGWPGEALRTTYERFDTAFKTAWRDWFRQHA